MEDNKEPNAQASLWAILDPDPAKAEEKYETLYFKLVKYFQWKGCTPDRAHDLAQECVTRVLDSVRRGKKVWAANPASYFFGVARLVWLEETRTRRIIFEEVQEDTSIAGEATLGNPVQNDEGIYLHEILETLDPQDRHILLEFESNPSPKDRARLARQVGLSRSGLGTRVFRIKDRIRKQFASFSRAVESEEKAGKSPRGKDTLKSRGENFKSNLELKKAK